MQTGYITASAVPGFVTRSGAEKKSITLSEAIGAGLPVKEVDGVAQVLATGDGLDAMIGIVPRYHDGWALQPYPQEIGVLSKGYIQVPAADGITPKRNQPAFFDPAAKVFTTDSTKLAVRAVFAADGIADGCAEIEVVQQVKVGP